MKKIIIMLTISTICFQFFIPQTKVQAVTGVAVRIVGASVGERAVAAVAEKAGVKLLTKTARQKAVERWNLQMYEKIKEAEQIGDTYKAEELLRFQTQMKNLTTSNVVPIPEKPGFGKIMLDTALFLTGADMAVDLYQDIKTAKENNKGLERMEETARALASGTVRTKAFGMGAIITNTTCLGFGTPTHFTGASCNVDLKKEYWAEISSFQSNYQTGIMTVYYKMFFYLPDGTFYTMSNQVHGGEISTLPQDFNTIRSVPTANEVPTLTPLPWLDTYRETGVIPDNAPEQIEIEIPLEDTYPEDTSVPWNEPITEIAPQPEPQPEPEEPPTDDPPADDTIGDKKIDWEKLKSTFTGFTTKFPFSLPWDIERAFDAVFPDPSDIEKPEWEFKIKKPDGTYHFQKFTIDEEFEQYIDILRTAILILFNISLVYAIRQWFGGAS